MLYKRESGQTEDLDQCILQLTEATNLPFIPRPGGINIFNILSLLAEALLQRSTQLKQPDDVNLAIEYLHCLRDGPLEDFGISRNEAKVLLMRALAFRANLGCGGTAHDIIEIIPLCNELLVLDISVDVTRQTLESLAGAMIVVGYYSDRSISDQLIKLVREASIRFPNSNRISLALARCHMVLFFENFADGDLEEATAILNRILISAPEFCPDALRKFCAHQMALLAHTRSNIYGKPEYAVEAMSQISTLLASHSLSDQQRHIFTRRLGVVTDRHLKFFDLKSSSGLQEAPPRKPNAVCPPSLSHPDAPGEVFAELESILALHSTGVVQTSIQHLQKKLSNIPPGTAKYRKCLSKLKKSYLTKFFFTDDITVIEEAIKFCRLLLESIPPNGCTYFLATTLLVDLLKLGFERTNEVEYLNESVSLLHGVIKGPMGQVFWRDTFFMIYSILELCGSNEQVFYKVLQIQVENILLSTDNRYSPISVRLMFSCSWARLLRIANQSETHPLVTTAYEKAMSLMQASVMFAPNLQLQHSHLVSVLGGNIDMMPLDYSSYLVHTGQLEQAIETLERGRALFWSELRGFRPSIEKLSAVDPLLAEKFTAINQDLENLTISVLPDGSTEVNDSEIVNSGSADPFSRLLLKQRKLLEERDNLISHVQTLPGFEGFFSAPLFDVLRSAASRGPVIIINHSIWRSDILILINDSPPSLIPTSKSFYDDATRLKNELLDARKKWGLDSQEYERALASVLADLYNLVGQPVVDRLRMLKTPEQSRIWWCPTSVFCSLPLHAMGPIPSDDGMERYFSDLYIPSYTSTLSALIESRKPSTPPSRQPSLLLVAQPGKSLPGVKGEIKVIKALEIEVESLISKKATTAAVVEGLGRHQFVHFACHGSLEIGKPFDASFKLHGDERLTLLDIIRSRLPTAEFAFLSACHTAALTEQSIDDEGLHLVAALQHCGFRSVVGTMWAMADTDGSDLARHFYRSMLSGKNEVPHYERSAEALRDAARTLRSAKCISLERWVNFVHYGA